jgi:D-serine ammonia-lyase
VHAGVYPLCDLQQKATGLTPDENLSLGVVARVCSTYPVRETPQVLIDAGALAFSKDTGPSGDFGQVYGNSVLRGWRVIKVSQVH